MTSMDRAAKNTEDSWETSNALDTAGNEVRGHSGQLSGNLSVEGPFHSQCVMVTKTPAIAKQHKQPETGSQLASLKPWSWIQHIRKTPAVRNSSVIHCKWTQSLVKVM